MDNPNARAEQDVVANDDTLQQCSAPPKGQAIGTFNSQWICHPRDGTMQPIRQQVQEVMLHYNPYATKVFDKC